MGTLNSRLTVFDRMVSAARQVMIQRARKYSNATESNDTDCNKNIKACEGMGIPAEVGILIRLQDKLARLSNLVANSYGDTGDDESIEDTVVDIVNYGIIFLDVWLERRGQQKETTNV